MFRRVVSIFCLLIFSQFYLLGNDNDTDIQLKTYLEQDQVPQNREVIYHVELSWSGELSRYHISEIGEPVVTNLKLRGSGSANRFFADSLGNPISIKRFTYYFTPQSMGMAYIDGVIIKYEDQLLSQNETLLAQRLGVKIIEPLADTQNKWDVGTMVIILTVILFLMVLAYFVTRYFKQRKLNEEKDKVIPKTLEEKYLEMLKSNIELNTENRRESLNALVKLFKSFMIERFKWSDSPTLGIITGKLEREQVASDVVEKLKNLFERNELSKFAGEEISPHELHLYYDTIELVINRLKTVPVEPKHP